MSDENISNFIMITGASESVAHDYLQVADQDVEQAISLFLENDGASLGGGAAAPTTTTTTAPSGTPSQFSSPGADVQELTSDEALARQLQEQEDARRSRVPATDEVRAPIAPRTEILAGGPSAADFDFGMFNRPPMGRRQQRGTQPQQQPSIFNQGDSSMMASVPRSNSGSPGDSPNSNSSQTSASKARRLADLFRPPFDIMYRGSFEDARSEARQKSKWLIVNIQDPSEFACQVLNRDLWSEPFIKEIVRESFLFLQYGNSTPEGQRFTNLYSVRRFPHIAIVDPRTGESVKTWSKSLAPSDFMLEVTEFLEQQSPEVARPPSVKKSKTNVSEMSEEEQLNAAINASLQETSADDAPSSSAGAATSSYLPGGSEKSDENLIDEDDNLIVSPSASIPTNAFDTILPVKRAETTDMANSTRIQFRMADGSRVIRRFLKTDPVRYMFEFVKSLGPETQDRPFELVFNRQQLIDILDQEIQQAGLANAAVIVQFS